VRRGSARSQRDLPSFLAELKHRRVVHVAVVYAVVAFVSVQVANNFFPALQLPEWTVTLVVALLILGFPLALALAWVFDMTPEGLRRTSRSPAESPGEAKKGRANADGEGEAARGPSIAVLPFANMSADPENEYFSDGLTEELLNALARVRGLRVPARTSSFAFKGKSVDVRRIGEKLSVGAVLEGSVRKVGNRVRITAQLVNVADGYHVWSETYDRELQDVFAIQAEIAEAIVAAFRGKLTGDASDAQISSFTEDLETYDLYLRGIHHRDAGGIPRAIECFRQALSRTPGYALAHAGLAEAYSVLPVMAGTPETEAYPEAKAAALRAVELDPTLPEAHAALGYALLRLDWDWAGAERHLTRAIELNSSYAVARDRYAEFLVARGRLAEGLEESRRAQALDPLSLDLAAQGALWLYCARDYQGAVRQAEGIIGSDPGSFKGHWYLGLACLGAGQLERGVAALEKTVELAGGADLFRAFLACGYAAMGRTAEARAILEDLEAARAERHVPSAVFPLLYAAVGDEEQSLDWLEKAVEERSVPAFVIPHEALFDPLREHPRFQELLRRGGLL